MSAVTLAQLVAIMPLARARAPAFLAPLNAAMVEFGITTPARQASFLAQVGHESGSLAYVRELASGQAYEGRADLGNTQRGDGVRFRGRGLLQVTGRTNYAACGKALGLDLLAKPELLEQTVNACRSAGWFWQTKGLNALADAGDQVKVTRRINGGVNGLAERLALFQEARKVLV
ncbi:chitinase class I [Janthinobacterium sp. HH103]|uniref:glycoside hydrolase family 19 protein n=1 Tax=unclassified Janthinobacterium TaxID=2610881 RepID=UPI000893E759|nr:MULTISPECIES: glycoside hydrolase family 19 protein [unclassified Janthinobacterium]OEZ56955.1 chitinase class I [Janthinobacterium sp. HH100]OEZ84987.1 chitinase class I [Janthinobacterium sp. HH103]